MCETSVFDDDDHDRIQCESEGANVIIILSLGHYQ